MARLRSGRTLNVKGNGVVPTLGKKVGAAFKQPAAVQKTGRRVTRSQAPAGSGAGGAPPPGTVGRVVLLKYAKKWTPAQRKAAADKIAALNSLGKQGKLVKTVPVRGKGASATYRQANGPNSVPKGHDVDHTHELQMGGADALPNMKPLDASVNRSIGSQIARFIKPDPPGATYGGASIKDRP